MSYSDIIRVTTGAINTVNDTIIAGQPNLPSVTVSAEAGQLGKLIELGDDQLFYSSAMGTVYGGRFRYVRLAAAATAVVVGQIVFWDISVANSLFQVTTSEAGSNPGAQLRAGIVLNSGWTAGNYSFIQDIGPTFIKFRAALTHVPTGIGVSCIAAGAGAGVDNGFADCQDSADPATFGDVNLFQNRYLGASIGLPSNGSLTLVNLNPLNTRG